MTQHVGSTGPAIETSQEHASAIDHHIRDPGAIFAIAAITSRTSSTIIASGSIKAMNQRIASTIVSRTLVHVKALVAAHKETSRTFGTHSASLCVDTKIETTSIVGSAFIDIHATCFAIASVAGRTATTCDISTGSQKTSRDGIAAAIIARTCIDSCAIRFGRTHRTRATAIGSVGLQHTSMNITTTIVGGTSIQGITSRPHRNKSGWASEIDRDRRIVGTRHIDSRGHRSQSDHSQEQKKHSALGHRKHRSVRVRQSLGYSVENKSSHPSGP